ARAIAAGTPSEQPTADDLLLTGWTLLTLEGHPAGTELLKEALRALRSGALAGDEATRGFATRAALLLWDDESWHVLSARHVKLVRDTGALTALPFALAMYAESEMLAGELSSVRALLAESDAIAEASGSAQVVETSLLLGAWRGQEARAR